MSVLLDECIPKRLKKHLHATEIKTVPEAGWSGKKNGALLGLAEKMFDVFLTVDQNLRYQQRLPDRNIAVIIINVPDNRLESFLPYLKQIKHAVDSARSGYVVRIPATRA